MKGRCYFADLSFDKQDIITCNECGFCDEKLRCKYSLCPHSSPTTCEECGYIDFSEGIGKCTASIKTLALKKIGKIEKKL